MSKLNNLSKWIIWYFEFFWEKCETCHTTKQIKKMSATQLYFHSLHSILGWIISINIKSEHRNFNSCLTLSKILNIYVPTFELWEHIIGCYAQSMTIKLTWMINYHLRSSPSCFVSFWGKNKAMCYNNFILVSVTNCYQIDL